MKYTNKHDFDDVISTWLRGDEYKPNPDPRRISVTDIQEPVKQFLLKRRHGSDLTEDLLDLYNRRVGTAIHESLEHIDLKDCEKEIKIVVPADHGYTIVGKFDLVYQNQVCDYKTTKITSMRYSKDKDWAQQLSLYRYLYYKQFDKVLDSKGVIYCFLLDWTRKCREYTKPIVKFELPLWSLKKVEKIITERVQLLHRLEDVPDKDLMHCNDKEMWNGRKCCDSFCNIKKWCNQWTRLK